MARILQVHQPVDGGVARYIRDLYHGLTAAGHDVITCGPRPADGMPEQAVHIDLPLTRSVDVRRDGAAVRSLRAAIALLRPDVVHAHSSKAGAIARLANAVPRRVPLVYTPHLFAFASHFSRATERGMYRVAEQLLAPLADRILCVCEAEAGLARSLGIPGRVRVVHYGVPAAGLGDTDPRMEELRRAGPVICALAVLGPRKGVDTLIDAAPAVLTAVPGAQFAIWGYGAELEALRSRAETLGAARAVHFFGPTADPISVLRGSGTFVLPSWAEAFPYVVLEAMSVACPIVASDVGGISEALDGGACGRLVSPGDADALAIEIIGLLMKPASATEMGLRARNRVSENYTTERMLSGVTAVYDELLASRR